MAIIPTSLGKVKFDWGGYSWYNDAELLLWRVEENGEKRMENEESRMG